MELKFYSENCSTTDSEMTAESVAGVFNTMGFVYDSEAGTLTCTPPQNEYYALLGYAIVSTAYGSTDERILLLYNMSMTGEPVTVTLSDYQKTNLKGFKFEGRRSGGSRGNDYATAYLNADIVGDFIYPVGEISISDLPVTPIGFKGLQAGTDYSHVQIVVAEILDDGTVGGEKHVWQSDFFSKAADYTIMLDELVPICEGQALTQFNVSYYFLMKNDAGEYEFVRANVVGGATNVPTFVVAAEEIPQIKVDFDIEGKVYCLSPVMLTVNRQSYREIEKVQVKVAGYSGVFEFYQGRNVLQIDLSEYFKTLWANVDIFEHQQMTPSLSVHCLDAGNKQLISASFDLIVIFGKKPDGELGDKLRVQWVDRYGYLHDEYFMIVDSVSAGEISQKYTSKREEREDKSGEKSINLAYVWANNQQREALKTIVFSDNVRAYIGERWKRVKVANSYKTGKGREKQNFEFTIKYAL